MKAARMSVMVLGVVFLMFVIAPYGVSAQGHWFNGKVSIKGWEVTGGGIVGKAGGGATAYFNILDDPTPGSNRYLLTTCLEDFDLDGVWHRGLTTAISKDDIYGDPAVAQVWDFTHESEMNFPPAIYAYPMLYVKIKGSLTAANFKSFACILRDESEGLQLGSCSISFKNVVEGKVPSGCITPP